MKPIVYQRHLGGVEKRAGSWKGCLMEMLRDVAGASTLLVALEQAPVLISSCTASRCPCHAAIKIGRIPYWN